MDGHHEHKYEHYKHIQESGLSNDEPLDLSDWSYSELRSAINETPNPELLQQCRDEFHRRLKVYHAWKAKHPDHLSHAHHSISLDGVHLSAEGQPPHPRIPHDSQVGEQAQRYFKVPFVLPHEPHESTEKKKGMWYSHFDGMWIARQMEIYDDKPAVLLLAGVDDMNMCELSLEETGLTQKRAAEILESEFEAIWSKNGGAKYLSDHQDKILSKHIVNSLRKSS